MATRRTDRLHERRLTLYDRAMLRHGRRIIVSAFVALSACGGSAPSSTTTAAPTETEGDEAPAPQRLTCFSGTRENGVCETFYAHLEPLGRVAAHCRESGGVPSDGACPTDGRVGACAHDAHEDVYYGGATTPDQLEAACTAEGGVFTP